MTNERSNIDRVKRNPYITKWNILFDRGTAQWISFKPEEGLSVYPCYACRDMFGSKNSFIDHVNRRGILLKYKCPQCTHRDLFVFYNPCALLLHTRQHYNLFFGRINLDDITVDSLPLGLAGFAPESNCDNFANNIENNNISTKFYSPLRQNMGQQVINLAPTVLLFFHTKTSNKPGLSLVLKQVDTHIPLCKFVLLENDTITSDVSGTSQRQNVENNDVGNLVNNSNLLINGNSNTKSKCSTNNQIVNQNKNSKVINIQHDIEIKEEPLDSSNVTCDLDFSDIPSLVPKNEVEETENQEKENENSFNRCSECKKVQTTSMHNHFINNNNKPIHEHLKCNVCKYVAPSKCSLQAHQRIHEGTPPFVCPECGKDFCDCETLLDHLDDVCFHLAKQVRYKCPKTNCCKVFAQTQTFITHFAVHVQTLTRCRLCNTYFFALSDYLEHTKMLHGNAVSTELIYKCTVCTNGGPPFTEEMYQNHIKWHCTNRAQCVYVYVCKYCRNFFRSTTTYATHLLRCAKKAVLEDDPSKLKKSNTATICSNCGYIIRMITTISNCLKCGEPFNTPYTVKQTQDTNTLADIDTSSSYCINSPEKMICLLCNKELECEEKVNHFLKDCKYINSVVVLDKISVNKDFDTHKSDENHKKKRKRQSTTPTSLKNKKLTSNSEPDLLQLDEPTPFDGIYHCRFCKYSNQDRKEFHQHVVTHRDISTAYQCMECGECFVVKPSLYKHLLYYHQVTDCEKYMLENNCFDKNAVTELQEHMKLAPGESKEPVAENQCGVCREVFDDVLQLNKHFRGHGMAFLLKNIK